jgi:hypothetical protein
MVCWNKIKQSKDNGGLGVRGIKEMNAALLLKLWWRFGNEKDALWRKVVCAKYNIDPRLWQPNMELNRMVSTVWKDILQIKSKNPEVFSKYSNNISISIGDGLSTQFWNNP